MMLAELFVLVCRMSVTALLVAVPVMLLSLVFDWLKVPKKFSCLLFALVLFRMLCPLALPGQISMFNVPLLQDTQQNITARFDAPAGDYEGHVAGTEEYDRAVAAGVAPEEFYGHEDGIVYYKVVHGEIKPADRAMDTWVPVLAKIWLVGMAVFYGFTLLAYLRLKRKLRFAVKLEGNVYVSDRIPSPCVVGYFRPCIYLVPGLSETEQAHILAHERAHLRAGDHWAKLIAWLALGVHWFNYLLWGVHSVYCAQIEGACDERVIREADDETREAYSQTLLNLAYNRRFRWLNPVSFSEGGTKERVKNVLRYKKPSVALIVLAVAASAALLVSCGTDGVTGNDEQGTAEPIETVIDHTGTLTKKQIAALETREGAYIGMDPSMEWVNTKGFSAMEILNVESEGNLYTMEVLEGTVLFGWLAHVDGYENGVSASCFGFPNACRETYLWDGENFLIQDMELVGDTLQSGMEEFDVTGFSDGAKQCMEDTGAGLQSISATLCRQAAAWYGCNAFTDDCFVDGRIGSLVTMPDGSWYFYAYSEGDSEDAVQEYEGDLSILRDAGKAATDAQMLDASDWTTEQLVRALPASDGYFTDMLLTELGTRFSNDPESVLREITALGGNDRAAVCWALAGACIAQQENGAADMDTRIEALTTCSSVPAVQDTAQMMQEDYDVILNGGTEMPAQEQNTGGWVVQGPVTVPAQAAANEE